LFGAVLSSSLEVDNLVSRAAKSLISCDEIIVHKKSANH
jgi:hypothetical protein